jgi:hypothetical protein
MTANRHDDLERYVRPLAARQVPMPRIEAGLPPRAGQ